MSVPVFRAPWPNKVFLPVPVALLAAGIPAHTIITFATSTILVGRSNYVRGIFGCQAFAHIRLPDGIGRVHLSDPETHLLVWSSVAALRGRLGPSLGDSKAHARPTGVSNSGRSDGPCHAEYIRLLGSARASVIVTTALA